MINEYYTSASIIRNQKNVVKTKGLTRLKISI